MTTGSITLTTKQLPAVADSVYLLAEDAIPGDGTILYEASLDGGSTFEAVTSGQLAELNHTGDQLTLRLTITQPEASEDDPPEVSWFLAYATQEV